MKREPKSALTFVLLAFAVAPSARAADNADLLITGGKVIDGTGNPWFEADLAVRDGRIIALGKTLDIQAERTLNAAGHFIAPGFIDLHSHMAGRESNNKLIKWKDPNRRAALNLVTQGITTVVVNQDGGGPVDLAAQMDFWRTSGQGPNLIFLVGHNAIRAKTLLNDFRRPATAEEIQAMQQLLRDGLAAGAWGMSSGLEYSPSIWAATDELVQLARVLAPDNRVLIVHERSSGADPFWWLPSQHDKADATTMLDNIFELIDVSERTGVTTVATHVKVRGANYWGSSTAMIRAINQARRRGVNIYADQYPYNTSGSDGRLVLIPPWFRQSIRKSIAKTGNTADYADALRKALAISETAEKLRRDVKHVIRRRGGPENITVMESKNPDFQGKTIAQLSRTLDLDPVDVAFHLQLDGDPHRPGGVRLRSFSMAESDVEALAAQPWCATSTDAGHALPGDGPVHARFYGSYPRKIRHYAMTRRVMTVEDAVRSSTSLPAQILGLQDRGLIRQGNVADLVIFDPRTIRDTATFENPHQYAEGIPYVLIAGEFLVDNGQPTRALKGKVLTPK